MLELWILLAVSLWVALMTLVVALCAASSRADRCLTEARSKPRTARRPAGARGLRRV
jgi:hypothetical protein